MVTVRRGAGLEWTGLEAGLLRKALRMSVRGYAAHLGVGIRTVSKWESKGAETHPWPDNQAILDTALTRADAAARARFEQLCAEDPARRVLFADKAASVDHETWTEDLERIVVCLDRQDFTFASALLDRWLRRVQPEDLDERGLYLFGRSMVLSGDLRRLQGTVRDLVAARSLYLDAHDVFTELHIPRRAAQIELTLGVVTEMSGSLAPAATRYQHLVHDTRLSTTDRARALLWIGTALSKSGENEFAIRVMRQAAEQFEQLEEPEEWATAQQKLALAHRGAGDLTMALHHIDTARNNGRFETPLQRVQIETAQAHILVTDTATRTAGWSALDHASGIATQYGLQHQLRSINNIRSSKEFA